MKRPADPEKEPGNDLEHGEEDVDAPHPKEGEPNKKKTTLATGAVLHKLLPRDDDQNR